MPATTSSSSHPVLGRVRSLVHSARKAQRPGSCVAPSQLPPGEPEVDRDVRDDDARCPAHGPIIAHGSARVTVGGLARWVAIPPASVVYISHFGEVSGQHHADDRAAG